MSILRTMMDATGSTLRRFTTAYKGASRTDAAMAAWNPARISPNGALLPEMARLISRTQDSDRNNGIARAAVQAHVDNVVGVGFILSARPNWRALKQTAEWAETWSQVVEAKWAEYWWSTQCHAGDMLTGDQLTTQAYRTQLQSGEACALPLWLPGYHDSKYSTRIMLVDPIRLSQPAGTSETVSFHGGMELDEYNGVVAYHFKRTNDGDTFASAPSLPTWERVPRLGPNNRLRVLHLYEQRYPGQTRGEPLLAAVLPLFKQLDRYTEAEVMAAVANACVSGVITTPLEADDILELFNGDHDKYLAERSKYQVGLSPGIIAALFPGDKLESYMPNRPASGFGPFVENLIRIVAVGVGLPYELLFKDFSKANYSSMRAAMLEAWRTFLRERDTLSTQWMDPIYALWLEEMIGSGEVEAPAPFYENRMAYLHCRWIGTGRGWVDPLKEAQAARERMDGTLSTLEDECAEQGKRWRDVIDQRAIESAYAKQVGAPDPHEVKVAPAPFGGKPGAKPDDTNSDDPEEGDPGAKDKAAKQAA